MAKHDFGIMQTAPHKGKRYDKYEPEKYNCISIDDDYIENIQEQLCVFDSYAHTIDCQIKGLAYCGITLIPPVSINLFIKVIENIPELSGLKNLLITAKCSQKYVIHFGI